MTQLPVLPPEMNAHTQPKKGMSSGTIVAIVLGAVGGILVLLVVLLPLVESMAKRRAREIACETNLRALGKSMQLYTDRHGDAMPPDLQILVKEEDFPTAYLRCPCSCDDNFDRIDYIYVPPTPNADRKTIVACEASPFHRKHRIILRGDMEAYEIPEDQFQKALADPENAHFAKEFRKAGGQ